MCPSISDCLVMVLKLKHVEFSALVSKWKYVKSGSDFTGSHDGKISGNV